MIVGTLLFNDEFEMLDIHLSITEKYVDRWIILEASRTFSGLEKPYHLKQNITTKVNKKFHNKIEIVTLPLKADQTNLICETLMRKGLAPSLGQYSNEDIIIHGDLDEIINPEKWQGIIETLEKNNKPVSCPMDMYMYKLDRKAVRGWQGSVVARKNMFETPHDLYKGSTEVTKRKRRINSVSMNEPVGWHWTWIGTDELIKNKVVSCIESQHRDPNEVLDALKDNDTQKAINHKCITNIVTPNYPESVMAILKKYPLFWHNIPL